MSVKAEEYNPDYDYRCIVQTLRNGTRTRHQILLGRSKPDWLTSLRVESADSLHVELHVRGIGDEEADWQPAVEVDVGRMEAAALHDGGIDNSEPGGRKIPLNWERAPSMKLSLAMGNRNSGQGSGAAAMGCKRTDVYPLFVAQRRGGLEANRELKDTDGSSGSVGGGGGGGGGGGSSTGAAGGGAGGGGGSSGGSSGGDRDNGSSGAASGGGGGYSGGAANSGRPRGVFAKYPSSRPRPARGHAVASTVLGEEKEPLVAEPAVTRSGIVASTAKWVRPAEAVVVGDAVALAGDRVAAAPATATKLLQNDTARVLRLWEALAFRQDEAIEFLTQRLLHKTPSIIAVLGNATPLLQVVLQDILNLAVHEALVIDGALADSGRWRAFRETLDGATADVAAVRRWRMRLCELGMTAEHWTDVGEILLSTLSLYAGMRRSQEPSVHRFFEVFVRGPVVAEIDTIRDVYGSRENANLLLRAWAGCTADKRDMGVHFYKTLLERYPAAAAIFANTNIDSLSQHLFDAVELLVNSFSTLDAARPVLNHLAGVHAVLDISTALYDPVAEVLVDTFIKFMPMWTAEGPPGERLREVFLTLFVRVADVIKLPRFNHEKLLGAAFGWVDEIARDMAWQQSSIKARKATIADEVSKRGTYSHTEEELVHGARVAWRNAFGCPGRSEWKSLDVRDCRLLTSPDEIVSECLEHQRAALQRPDIAIKLTVFSPEDATPARGIRFWNSKLLQYACYKEGETVLGDPANEPLTSAIMALGWMPPESRTCFDLLPLVLETADGKAYLYNVPPVDRREVKISHPSNVGSKYANIKWPAVPMILDYSLKLGGISYSCCAINGRFVKAEVATALRRTCGERWASGGGSDADDCYALELVKLQLSEAVAWSYRTEIGPKAVEEHRTVLARLQRHNASEEAEGRLCPAMRSWPAPAAIGMEEDGHAMDMVNRCPTARIPGPYFVRQAPVWRVRDGDNVTFATVPGKGHDTATASPRRVLVLYASETGTARNYAFRVRHVLQPLPVDVAPLNHVAPAALKALDLSAVLIVSSSVGNGDVPANGRHFLEELQTLPAGTLSGVRFSVMAIGSSTYWDFCRAGSKLAVAMAKAGAEGIVAMHKADENGAQSDAVDKWLDKVTNALGLMPQAGYQVAEGDVASSPSLKIELLSDYDPLVLGAVRAGPEHFQQEGFHVCPITRNEVMNGPESLGGRGEELRPPPAVISSQEYAPPSQVSATAHVVLRPGRREVRFIELDVIGTGFPAFGAGDHVLVPPQNPPELVQLMCAHVKFAPSQWFNVISSSKGGSLLFPLPMTVGQLFTAVIDLNVTAATLPPLLRAMQFAAKDAEDDHALQTWLDKLDDAGKRQAVQTQLLRSYVNVPQLLAAHPSVQLSLGTLVAVLPMLKPRFYSLASSSVALSSRLQFVVGVLRATESGAPRDGQSSSFIAGLQPRVDALAVRLSRRFNNLPVNPRGPLVIAAAGTALAPFRALFQERALLPSTGQSCVVYYGCRTEGDILFRQELVEWQRSGVITELRVAVSRSTTAPRQYIQDLIAADAERLWPVLSDPACHFCFCGDSKMGEDVMGALRTIAMDHGLSHTAIVDLFEAMRTGHRMFYEPWGVRMHFTEANTSFRDARTQQAEGWLDKVHAAEAAAATTRYTVVEEERPDARPCNSCSCQ